VQRGHASRHATDERFVPSQNATEQLGRLFEDTHPGHGIVANHPTRVASAGAERSRHSGCETHLLRHALQEPLAGALAELLERGPQERPRWDLDDDDAAPAAARGL